MAGVLKLSELDVSLCPEIASHIFVLIPGMEVWGSRRGAWEPNQADELFGGGSKESGLLPGPMDPL